MSKRRCGTCKFWKDGRCYCGITPTAIPASYFGCFLYLHRGTQ